jgi:ADP-dependent NAD(P)H-hydrate dehydratase
MAAHDWTRLDPRLLRRWPLPVLADDADKEVRGRVLVIAGSREIPGAALLAATAALRAGAGKLVIATAQSIAPPLALAVPEARVLALPENDEGSFAMGGIRLLEDSARRVDAALIGPGLMDAAGSCRFIAALLPSLAHAPVVLDALAMDLVRDGRRFEQPVLLTPHAGEMAHLRGIGKKTVTDDPAHAVTAAAADWQATVALKGADTLIATANGGRWRHEGGHPGLATSGSGDVLAGAIAGLAAQGVPLEQACAWGVVLHALAGAALGRRVGPLGYLARELPGELPALMRKLQQPRRLNAQPAPRESSGG